MATEVHKITFAADELLPVITDYCIENGIHTPGTKINSVRVDPGPPISVTLIFPGHSEDEPYELHVDKNRLLAALIRATKVMGIRLPRAGEKHLVVDDKGISLMYGMSTPYR